jgi:DNA-directed RNA polymerase subunit RPC12/RpoP
MPATEAPALERDREVREARTISSYKCEDCGKIIAAPGENPAPRCCGAEMRKIR